MSEEELKRLEALCERYEAGPADGSQADMRHEFATALPAALAEIRRLKALVKDGETTGEGGGVNGGCGHCVWCGAYRGQGEEHDHEPHQFPSGKPCPAFTPDGEVR